MAVERKYERDVDVLLAEEFSVNGDFAEWVRSKTRNSAGQARVAEVFVSKADNLGESDLIILYENNHGGRFALMVEDKVDAPLQPEQAARYRLRAQREMQLGLCDEFEVWLFAPSYYLDRCLSISEFDGALAYEEIADFLRRNSSHARNAYRAEFLQTAAVRRANNWVRQSDDATNAFWEAAYKLAARKFPILEMKRLNVTRDSTWVNFRPADMPTQPKRIYISFKGDRGQMDLTFSNVQAHCFGEKIEHVLEADMTVHQTKGSAAIRLEVEGFSIGDGIDVCLARVEDAFRASERLIRFFRQHRSALENAAKACEALPSRVTWDLKAGTEWVRTG